MNLECIIDIAYFISNVNTIEKEVNNGITCKAVGAEPKLVRTVNLKSFRTFR